MTTKIAGRIATAGVVLALTTAGSRAETITLPTFDVVATTPLGGGEIDVAKSPFAVWQTNSQDIQTFNDTTLTETLARQAPGVTVGNVSGNDFQPDLSYRGFNATPVSGSPIGLAVYQNGVRINEAFGDTVNWDLIPENAIDHTAIVAGNPIFGLNAIGGAITMTMKNGFTYQGFEGDVRGGSFGRAQEEFQYGKQIGNYSVYVAGTQINDGGWRVDGASQLSNFYGDVGYKANGFESHLQLSAGNSQLGVAAFTPLQLLQNSWSSLYTVPQTTYNKMAMLNWTGSYAYSPTLSFQANAYFRGFNQAHVDGNGTDVFPCAPSRAWAMTTATSCMTHSGSPFPICQMAERLTSAKLTETGRSRVPLGPACRPSTRLRSMATTTRSRSARLLTMAGRVSTATASSAPFRVMRTTIFSLSALPSLSMSLTAFLIPSRSMPTIPTSGCTGWTRSASRTA